ncbi:CHAT domain-containing protein [Siansivirga zeaxanthinifaciens]|nr:CHAT domain-containing protein [Siansivirga zeaxanthinifaciens]
MKRFCFILFLIGNITFSQNLEEAIYTAAEAFIAHPNEITLQQLNKQESLFKNQLKSKDEQLAFIFLQCHKAYYLNETGDFLNAISTYEAASKRFFKFKINEISDFDITENCLKPLGNLYTKTGDFTNAENTITQYIFLAETKKNTKHQVSGAINRAKLYFTLGKYESVVKIINDALKIPNISETQIKQLENFKTNGLIALKNYEKANTLIATTKASNFITYKNNYSLAFKNGDYKTALEAFNLAKVHLNEADLDPRNLSKFYVEEAQLHYVLNNKTRAKESLMKALHILIPKVDFKNVPSKQDLYPENTFIDIFDLLAALENNPITALQYFDLSFYVSSLFRNQWTSQENKLQNQASDRIRSEKCIDLLFNEYLKTKNQNHIIQAFQYAENNKASVLKDITLKKIRLQEFPNDSLLKKEYKLLNEQERLTNLLIKAQLNKEQASKLNALSQKLNAISIEIKAIQKENNKKYTSSFQSEIAIENLQQKLKKDNATLIEYFYGKHTLYQFIISENNITINDMPLNDDFNKLITNFIHLFDNSSIINNNIPAFTKQAFGLYNTLHFEDLKTTANLIIIPDGLLNFVPFDALLTEPTNSLVFSKMPFVVKHNNLAYNWSSFFYLNSNNTSQSNNMLGVFPVFENSQQPLTFSIDEANAIKDKMPATLLFKDAATKLNFTKIANKYDILHLSTHASSGNFITPAHIEFYDETLYLNELYSLDLNSQLVVLSACETGIGKLYKGEGAMSLARGFQFAGAKNILFTLWQINDLSTSQIMASFYDYFSKNESAFISNHRSKLDYLENENISNNKKSPYYWSAFSYYGNLEQEKTTNNLFYKIIGLLIGLLALFLLLKLKKHDRKTATISS